VEVQRATALNGSESRQRLHASRGGYRLAVTLLFLLLSSRSVGAISVTNGTVVGWGYDASGLLSQPAGLTDIVAIAAGYTHNLAVRRDGTVVPRGDYFYYTNFSELVTNIPADLSNVVSVAAGLHFSLALRSDGTVVAWGDNTAGQVSVPNGLTGVVAIAAGNYHSVALKQDGTVTCWGSPTSSPVSLTGVVAIAAGSHHTLALRGDGTVAGWGHNYSGETIPPPGLAGVAAVAAGDGFSLAALSNGTVVAWGRALALPALSNVVAVEAGNSFGVALHGDSTVSAWGWGYASSEVHVPFGLSNVVAVSAGSQYALALVNNPPDPPMIAEDPQDQVVKAGLDATLSALGWGTGPLSYRWRKGDAEIPIATNWVLSLPNAAAHIAGGYRVVVRNPYGSATSHVATVTVEPSPPRGIYVVNNNQDSGPGSLRQALFAANAVGGGTILFSNVTGTLRLGSALPAIKGETSILGPGSNGLTLSGFDFSSAFSMAAGSTCSLSGLSFSGFSAADYANGAVISNAGAFHVTNCAFLNNSTRGFGGAIYNVGDLILASSTFSGNVAGRADGQGGGGGGGAGLGGALYTTNGLASISNCVFAGNSAVGGNAGFGGGCGMGGRGGGLQGGAGGDTNGQPNGLPGGYGGGGGGGCYCPGYSGCCGTGGSGGFGGGAGQGVFDIAWCNGQSGEAGLFGGGDGGGAGIGGALFMESGVLKVIDTTFVSNRVAGGYQEGSALGGALYAGEGAGMLDVIDCTFVSNRIVGGNYGGFALGGALYLGGGTVLVTNSTVTGNQLETTEGGFSFRSTYIALPAGDALGAGIYVDSGVVTIANSTLAGNRLKSGDGGSGSRNAGSAGRAAGAGLYVEDGAVSLINVTVSNNEADAGNNGIDGESGWGVAYGGGASGGGVFVRTGAVSLVNCTLTLNYAVGGLGDPPGYQGWDLRGGGFGGGLANGRGTVRLLNTIIANNGARWTTNSMHDVGGSLLSDGFNLVGNTNGATGFLSDDLINAWPSLGSLQFNGGPTLTHALMPGSSAIDAGTAVDAPLTDQRGFARPAGRGHDIGAYEYRSAYETIRVEGGKVMILFVTEPNLSYQVQAASNLFDWQMIATAPASTNGQFLLQEVLQPLPRFYRAALPP